METRLWIFSFDMNGDGVIGIADVWLWLQWLFFYPGDLFVLLFINSGLQPALDLVEFTNHYYGGVVSGIFSIMVWAAIWRFFATHRG